MTTSREPKQHASVHTLPQKTEQSMVFLKPFGSNSFCEAKGNGECYRKKEKRELCNFFVAFTKSTKSEIVNEPSSVNMNMSQTASNSELHSQAWTFSERVTWPLHSYLRFCEEIYMIFIVMKASSLNPSLNA